MASRKSGYAAKSGEFFLTKKGEFLPLCDSTAVYPDKGSANSAMVERLGTLLPETLIFEVVHVSRVWVEA